MAWWNNSDKGHFRRMVRRGGRDEAVMMEAEGPGAIVRIWSANPVGNIRIYLDDMETPAIEADMAALLGRIGHPKREFRRSPVWFWP